MAIKTYRLRKVENKQVSDHFRYGEFECPTSEELKLDGMLPLYLEALMQRVGADRAVITSGYRTPAYSVQVGGTKTDKHTMGMAADVVFYDGQGKVIDPALVSCAAESLGFIGGIAKIGSTAVHIDTRSMAVKYWGDESTGSTNSIWNFSKHRSFYSYYGIDKPKEVLVDYRVKRSVIYRNAPFKQAARLGRLKRGTLVKVVKGGRITYAGKTFYHCKLGKIYCWINRKYLKQA